MIIMMIIASSSRPADVAHCSDARSPPDPRSRQRFSANNSGSSRSLSSGDRIALRPISVLRFKISEGLTQTCS